MLADLAAVFGVQVLRTGHMRARARGATHVHMTHLAQRDISMCNQSIGCAGLRATVLGRHTARLLVRLCSLYGANAASGEARGRQILAPPALPHRSPNLQNADGEFMEKATDTQIATLAIALVRVCKCRSLVTESGVGGLASDESMGAESSGRKPRWPATSGLDTNRLSKGGDSCPTIPLT